MPVVALFAMTTMLVLRAGASRVFFDVVGSFQANRLIGDAQAKITVLQSLMLDGLSGITESVQLISDQMDAVVDSTVPLAQEIAKARLEFEKFANFQDVDMATEAIVNLGESYAFSGDQALAAGAKMAQLSDIVGGGKATVAATEIGMQFGMIGGMETEEAMKKMISLQQQTAYMYGDLEKANFDRLTSEQKANVVRANSIRMLNQLNTIENRSAATMSQITHVMNQFASSARLAGDETSYMAAMSATLIEAGEEQGKAGRALKMMYARLGANTGNNAEVLKKYGIEVKGANGELRSMEEILNDVAMRYDGLKDADRLALAQAMAGNDHYVRAIKLFENHSRVVRLDAQAVAELDTAQDELNKKMSDVSFQLQQQEARLFNAKAAVGMVFTPAVLKATKAQADLNEAFAGFAAESKYFNSAMQAMFTVQQVGKLYSPLVEAQLNIMSLNVSFRTQQQIVRALNNEQLVRSSAYGGQVAMQKIALDQLDQELSRQSQLTALKIGELGMEDQSLRIRSIQASQARGLTTQELAKARASKIDLQTSILSLEHKKSEMNTQNALTAGARQAAVERIKALKTKMQEKQAMLETKGILDFHGMAQKRIDEGHFKRLNTTQQVENNRMANKRTHFLMEEHNAKMRIANEKEINFLQETQQHYYAEMQALQMGLHFSEEETIQNLRQQEMEQTKLIANEGKRILMANMMEGEIKGQTQAELILGAASVQLDKITQMKSNTEQQNNAIVKQMTISAKELAAAYNLNEQEIMQILPKMKLFAQSFSQVQAQQDLTVQKSMRTQMAFMQMSGALSAVSMGFSMFGESERAARASMILMNIAMIPSVIQMGMMAKGTVAMGAAAMGASVGVDTLAASTTRLSIAMKAVGIGLAISALAYGAYLLAGKTEVDEATESMTEFGQAINYTKEEYDSLSETFQGQDIADLAQEIANRNDEIAQTTELIANTSDDSLLKSYEARLEALRGERAILLDIKNIQAAEDLTATPSDAESVFELVKAYQQAGDDLTEAQDNFGFFDKAAKYYFRATSMGDEDYMYTDTEKEIFALEDAVGEAFAAIPEHFHGAIMEMAEEADTMQDFMADLHDFIEADVAGLTFGGFDTAMQENVIGPIEAAKEAAFEFSNAREEMFFGMAKGNITGDMVKQVVNKGVETLINTTEVIMTNNFNGMTTGQAANEITKQVISQLQGRGLNITA